MTPLYPPGRSTPPCLMGRLKRGGPDRCNRGDTRLHESYTHHSLISNSAKRTPRRAGSGEPQQGGVSRTHRLDSRLSLLGCVLLKHPSWCRPQLFYRNDVPPRFVGSVDSRHLEWFGVAGRRGRKPELPASARNATRPAALRHRRMASMFFWMLSLSGLRNSLPAHLFLTEDPDFVTVRCARCGWSALFSASGAKAELVEDAARSHNCAGR